MFKLSPFKSLNVNDAMPFRIKICGVVRAAQVADIAAAGADAIGLNFVPTSKRRIDQHEARNISLATPPTLRRVGVFADASACEILDRWEAVGLDYIQLHGNEPIEVYDSLARDLGADRLIRALPWGDDHRSRWTEFMEYVRKSGQTPAAILVDSASLGQFGGTGLSLPWEQLVGLNTSLAPIPWVLAGGLNAENVARAILTASPSAVDVAGGVETSLGVKDLALVQAFCSAAQGAFASR